MGREAIFKVGVFLVGVLAAGLLVAAYVTGQFDDLAVYWYRWQYSSPAHLAAGAPTWMLELMAIAGIAVATPFAVLRFSPQNGIGRRGWVVLALLLTGAVVAGTFSQ